MSWSVWKHKGPEDDGKQLWWLKHSFPGAQRPNQEHLPGGRLVYVKVSKDLYQKVGKRRAWRKERTAHDPKHATLSGAGVMAWGGIADGGTGFCVCIDDGTRAKKQPTSNAAMSAEAYTAISMA